MVVAPGLPDRVPPIPPLPSQAPCTCYGDGASDVFVFLQRTVQRNLPDCGGCLTQWNYQKWLVAPDGSAFATYASAASPLDAEDDIERLLSGA